MASSANSPSAPISWIKNGAVTNKIAPIIAPEATIMIHEQVKMLFAFSSSFLPRQIDIGTEEPTPIRSANAKFMITKGIARLRAANAVSPKN